MTGRRQIQWLLLQARSGQLPPSVRARRGKRFRDMTDPQNETGLHEYVDAEFTVEGLELPHREKAVHDALEKLPGIESLSIFHGKVTVHYEPVILSQTQVEEEIRRAGFRITEAKATPSSPLTDALQQNLQTSESDSKSQSHT